MSEAQDIVQQALARSDARAAATPRIDYAGVKRVFPKQKAALTRAVNSGDPEKVVLACRKVVQEWSEPPFNGAWPDDWARWQCALDDALPWHQRVDLNDLR